ncbi:MAG TPA: transposase [Gammaproteobacteria bacterium]|nr:transposase [Gammaproteobacteria bacterium]
MARIARIVVPFFPHHVTQRGNRRQRTFFADDDYTAYLKLLSEFCRKAGTRVWAYCLMPNHVHLVMVPSHAAGLRKALGEAHRRYTRAVNLRNQWRGHLWQERFHSFPMDEAYLMAAARYVERNPVAARLCRRPQNWPWSSAAAHMSGRDDGLVEVQPMLSRIDDWSAYLFEGGDGAIGAHIAKHSRTGRPLGDEKFVQRLERFTGRRLARRRPGRKKKSQKK